MLDLAPSEQPKGRPTEVERPLSLSSGQRADQNVRFTDSAQVRAQLQLREMILAGELPGGARIAELSLVEKLGVSRTPIRAALMRLEQEGLLEPLPNGGYAVRTFSERDISEARKTTASAMSKMRRP